MATTAFEGSTSGSEETRTPALGRSEASRSKPLYEMGKRLFDIVFGLLALVLSTPVLVFAIAAIRLESSGPAIFRQTRMGRDGRDFTLYKLRGMYSDSHQRFPHLYDYSFSGGHLGEFFFHEKNDPRVTKVGRLLRKSSIDELPNFINVVRGDMSVVGPRPEIPDLAPQYGESLEKFLSVRPGVTSPAKASGRDALTVHETLERDLAYVDEQSLWVDLRTIAKTIASVLRGKDAS